MFERSIDRSMIYRINKMINRLCFTYNCTDIFHLSLKADESALVVGHEILVTRRHQRAQTWKYRRLKQHLAGACTNNVTSTSKGRRFNKHF